MKLYKTKEDEIYFYYLKNGKKRWMYRHKYKDVLGKRREKKQSSFKTEKEAQRSLLEVKASILNGQGKHVEYSQMTISQWMDVWYETYSNSWEISTQIQRKRIIDQQIKPLIGKYKLSKLDRTTYIREYINPLLKNYKPNTVQLQHRIFTIAINSAVDDEIVSRNRFTKVSFEMDEKLDNFLTPQELNVFISTASKCLDITKYTLVLLIAYTGIRHGEMLSIKWGNIDFKNNTITINSTRDQFGDRKPKTSNSYRTIPVDVLVIDQLKKYKKWCIQTKFKYGMQLDAKMDYVFIGEDNEPCTQNALKTSFRIIYSRFKKDGISIKRITPHGLRHTMATVLINNGIPPKTIADRLGNTVEMIYKVYTHSFKELEDKAVSVFSETIDFGAKSGAD